LNTAKGFDDFTLQGVLAVVNRHLSIYGNMSDRAPRHAEDDVCQELVWQASRNGRIGQINCKKVSWATWL
jgi:hypothetical protein